MADVVCIVKECPLCGGENPVEVPERVFQKWHEGVDVKEIWPEATEDQEQLLTVGAHKKCYDDMFTK